MPVYMGDSDCCYRPNMGCEVFAANFRKIVRRYWDISRDIKFFNKWYQDWSDLFERRRRLVALMEQYYADGLMSEAELNAIDDEVRREMSAMRAVKVDATPSSGLCRRVTGGASAYE